MSQILTLAVQTQQYSAVMCCSRVQPKRTGHSMLVGICCLLGQCPAIGAYMASAGAWIRCSFCAVHVTTVVWWCVADVVLCASTLVGHILVSCRVHCQRWLCLARCMLVCMLLMVFCACRSRSCEVNGQCRALVAVQPTSAANVA